MAQILNRAQTRDASRRDLGIVPPCDYPAGDPRNGPPGAQPAGNPNPSNQQLNDAYDNAISMLNAYVGYNTIVVPIPLPASSATGYVPISMANNTYLSNRLMASIGLQNFNDVRRVGWIASPGANYQQLYPFDIARSDRDQVIQDNNAAGTPQWYYTDQYNLYVTPPNGTAGTLEVTYGNGSISFCRDDGYIEQLPVDHHYCVRQIANKLITMKAPGNVELNTLFGMLDRHTQFLVERVAQWFQENNRYAQPTMGSVDIQRDYGCYRRQRR